MNAGKILLQLRTVGIAAAGVAVFHGLSLPLPWLLGPMFACVVAALLGLNLVGQPVVSAAMRTVLGVAAGAAITPALIGELDDMALSLSFIPLFIVLSGLLGYPYFRRVWGYDKATSYYAAMPGGLQDMIIFGEEAGGSPRVLSLVHVTRVLLVVSLVPFVIVLTTGASLDGPLGEPAASLPLWELILMVAIAGMGWWAAAAIGLFGASILGPLALAAAAALSGILLHRPPEEALFAAQFFIGLGVGVKYAGITPRELRNVVLAALGHVLILVAIAAMFAEIVIVIGATTPLNAMLAFAPGGQGEMIVLALAVGADVAFVVAHHVTRIVTVIVCAPLARRWLQ
ncbi:MAG: AbrB family transcriptional regulator [Pseudomonadota bacterium]